MAVCACVLCFSGPKTLEKILLGAVESEAFILCNLVKLK